MPARIPTSIPGIYAITLISTGRRYVGQARNIRKRWELHRHYLRAGKHHNFVLQAAWIKHGAKAFTFSILRDLSQVLTADLTTALNLAEIEEINAAKWPFNLTEGGDGGLVPTEFTRALLSEASLSQWQNPERRKRQTAAIKALYADTEWKARRDASVKAALNTPEALANSSARFTKMWQSEEHRSEQSARRKANWQDPDYRAQQTESRKATWDDPEVRAKRLSGMKAALTPEVIAKRAATMRATCAKKKAAKLAAQRTLL